MRGRSWAPPLWLSSSLPPSLPPPFLPPSPPSLPAGGFVSVSSALSRSSRHAGFTVEDVRRVVDTCPFQRYTLRDDPAAGELQIRANFGHSIKVGVVRVGTLYWTVCVCTHWQVEGLLTPVLPAEDAPLPLVVHGTSSENWQVIRTEVSTPLPSFNLLATAMELYCLHPIGSP